MTVKLSIKPGFLVNTMQQWRDYNLEIEALQNLNYIVQQTMLIRCLSVCLSSYLLFVLSSKSPILG